MVIQNTKNITILLNVYNAQNHIDSFFHSLKKQTFLQFSLLVIDDGSTDHTVEKIKSYNSFFDMKIIKRPHEGLRKARSYGVKQVDSDILIILDSDLILEPTAITELIKPFEKNDEIAAVGGLLKNAEKGLVSESYAALRNLFTKLRTNNGGYVDWVNGGFCAVRKKVIDEIGGYAKKETSEDLDISWKIQKKGYKLYLSTKSLALHFDPTTLKEIWHREYSTGKREYILTKEHKEKSLTIKRIVRFYPFTLPLLLVFFYFFWITIPVIFLISFIIPLLFLGGKIHIRIISWFTFNVMNFAYCAGFISSIFSKGKN